MSLPAAGSSWVSARAGLPVPGRGASLLFHVSSHSRCIFISKETSPFSEWFSLLGLSDFPAAHSPPPLPGRLGPPPRPPRLRVFTTSITAETLRRDGDGPCFQNTHVLNEHHPTHPGVPWLCFLSDLLHTHPLPPHPPDCFKGSASRRFSASHRTGPSGVRGAPTAVAGTSGNISCRREHRAHGVWVQRSSGKERCHLHD